MHDSDDLFDTALEHQADILTIFQLFADRKPIMLFDRQEQRIYAYPFADFRSEHSPKSQALLQEQYDEAVQNDQVVVFVRDNEKRRLASFTLNRG